MAPRTDPTVSRSYAIARRRIGSRRRGNSPIATPVPWIVVEPPTHAPISLITGSWAPGGADPGGPHRVPGRAATGASRDRNGRRGAQERAPVARERPPMPEWPPPSRNGGLTVRRAPERWFWFTGPGVRGRRPGTNGRRVSAFRRTRVAVPGVAAPYSSPNRLFGAAKGGTVRCPSLSGRRVGAGRVAGQRRFRRSDGRPTQPSQLQTRENGPERAIPTVATVPTVGYSPWT